MEQNPEEYKSMLTQLKEFLQAKFNLDEDKAAEEEVRENIARGTEVRGTNLWVLIFAIFIASVGLNVNSTAVIIGAMLVSPLMGPIMGIGLALGINDFELFKKSFRNFLFSVLVSIIASTLYFTISPLSTAQSELLARTTPTIWDVLIASFGGLAGIVAQSRKDRTSTVIPGVAIATALMPPLCTAGFGLASGNLQYFGGAFYLFFINAVFIAFATFFIVRFLKYKKKQFLDPKREKRVKHYIIIIITATLVPSIIMAYSIVQRAVFDNNAKTFVDQVLTFDNTEIINSSFNYNTVDGNSIEVILVGEPISEEAITMASNQLAHYKLTGTKLTIRQPSAKDELDISTIRSVLKSNTEILTEKNNQIRDLESVIKQHFSDTIPSADIARELSSLWSQMESFSISKTKIVDTRGRANGTILLCLIKTAHGTELTAEDNRRLTEWLKQRTKTTNVRLIIQ